MSVSLNLSTLSNSSLGLTNLTQPVPQPTFVNLTAPYRPHNTTNTDACKCRCCQPPVTPTRTLNSTSGTGPWLNWTQPQSSCCNRTQPSATPTQTFNPTEYVQNLSRRSSESYWITIYTTHSHNTTMSAPARPGFVAKPFGHKPTSNLSRPPQGLCLTVRHHIKNGQPGSASPTSFNSTAKFYPVPASVAPGYPALNITEVRTSWNQTQPGRTPHWGNSCRPWRSSTRRPAQNGTHPDAADQR